LASKEHTGKCEFDDGFFVFFFNHGIIVKSRIIILVIIFT